MFLSHRCFLLSLPPFPSLLNQEAGPQMRIKRESVTFIVGELYFDEPVTKVKNEI